MKGRDFMALLYIVIYIILCIITSVIVCHLGGFDIRDAPLIGIISIFSPIVLPIILLGMLGVAIYNKIENRFL